MFSQDVHEELIARLYASAVGEASWGDTLTRAAELFRSDVSIIQVSDSQGVALAVEVHGRSQEFAAEFYPSEIYANDPRVPLLKASPLGEVYHDHSLWKPEEMERDPRCEHSCEVLEVKHQLGVRLQLAGGGYAGFALLRTEQEGYASEAALRSLRRLVPHIEQACSLGDVLEYGAATRAALLEALTRKTDGVILLGASGQPTFMNDAARKVLAANDGLAVSVGDFVTRRGPETRTLQHMIGEVVGVPWMSATSAGGRMLVTRPSGLRPYVLHVMPAPPVERFLARRSVACVIYVQDLAETETPTATCLTETFGLTEREADLAVELVRTSNLAQAAANARMAVNTARNHLQSIFRKTGTTNQTEAVQLIGRLR